jgi:hypothetical protein
VTRGWIFGRASALRSITAFRRRAIGAFRAVEQAFDGGGEPARSAARRALIHGFELRADLSERQIGIGPLDPGDERDEAFAADF